MSVLPAVSSRVRSITQNRVVASCGCTNVRDPATGAFRNRHKCRFHARIHPKHEALDAAYYTELGVLNDGKWQPTGHCDQLFEALGDIPVVSDKQAAPYLLEIGTGASPYVKTLVDKGYKYIGLEPSEWACSWLRSNFGVTAVCSTLEQAVAEGSEFRRLLHDNDIKIDIILSAHCLEHLPDAPAALRDMANILQPGGLLYLVIPEGTDHVNSDHLWFFYEDSLRTAVTNAGLNIEALAVRRYVERERFIYCRARKPSESATVCS